MGFYSYSAVSRSGHMVEGEIEADTRHFVFERLTELGHLPVEVREVAAGRVAGGRTGRALGRAPKRAQITLMTRELAMLLKAGVTLDQALEMLEGDQQAKPVVKLIGRIRHELSNGRNFADALETQGEVFPPIYTNMVRVAEAGGNLDEVLEQIAVSREQDEKMRAKVFSALLYPAFLIVSAIAMVTMLLVFVIPRFKQVIMGTGAEVPEGARLVITASDWLSANIIGLAIVLLTSFLALKLALRLPAVRAFRDAVLFRLPVIGNVVRIHMTIRFCRTLATLLKSGVELPAALDLVRRIVSVVPASNAIGASIEALRRGQNFIRPLAESGIFFPVVLNMLRVGEETGSLANSAHYLTEMFQDKADVAIKRIMTILEPLIIIVVSLFVAGILIAILGAIISVNDLVI